MKKRIISMLLCAVMTLSFTGFAANAETPTTVWDGKEVQPTADSDGDGYIDITLPSHLAWVVANDGNSGGKFELLNDIWLNDITVNTANGTYINNVSTDPLPWYTCAVGSGKDDATFEGEIKGNGYTVHGLFYDDVATETEPTSPGLIPFPKSATVTDLKIDNSFIKKTGGSTVAAFSGRTHQITLTMLRCMVGEDVYIAGAAGAAGFAGGGGSGSKVTLTDCVSLATVTATSKAAGIAGDIWNANGWKLNNCYTTSSRAVGSTKVLSNSGNLYSVSGCNNSTALALEQMSGANAKTNMAFDFEKTWIATDSYPIPRVFFDGDAFLSAVLSGDDILFTVSYEGTVTASSLGIEIDGQEYAANNTYTLDAAADTVYSVRPFAVVSGEKLYGDTQTVCAAVLANAAYITADAVKRAELDTLFASSCIYKSGIWQTDGIVTKQPTADADNDGYIDITEASELAWVVDNDGNNGGKYELLNDIVLNDITVDAVNGTYKNNNDLDIHPWYTRTASTFVGEIKGNGHIVRGIFYDDNTTYFSDELRVAGALVPYPKNAVISGVGVEDSYLKIFSNYSVAAIAGCVHGSTIKLSIDSCYADDSVYVESYTAPGGILGGGGAKTTGYVKINNCYSLATRIFSKEYYGGIIGNNWSPKNHSITNCYSIGPIASNMGDASLYTAFENNYATEFSNRDVVTVVGKSDIQGYNAKNTMSGLNFDDVWVTTEGYPTLRIFEPELRAVEFGIADTSLDIADGIAFELVLDGKAVDGVNYGLEVNGEDIPIADPTQKYMLDADADTVYTVRAFCEKDGVRAYDKTVSLCAATIASIRRDAADDEERAVLDSVFSDSEIYVGDGGDSITFSLIADFHYIQGGYISSIADINAILKRANENNAAFIMSAGDFCNNYKASPELFKAYLENEYDLPAYNIYGNHELEGSGNSMANVTPLLTNDQNVVWGTEDGKIGDGSIGYYYFDNGGFRIVAIDTLYSFEPATGEWEHNKGNSTSPESDNLYTEALGPVQLAWLERVLLDAADKDIPCIVVGHDGMSGLFATSSADAAKVRGIFAKANAKNPGTVLMCINGHLHTNHQGFNEGVFYLDMNTVRNCLWSGSGTAHYTDGQTYMFENYDDEGNLIEIVEKNVTEASGSTKTWYAKDPLNAIVTVTKNGVITIDGVESDWLYGVDPNSSASGVEPRVSSGTYFDCSVTDHIYDITSTQTEHTLTCKNALCGHTETEPHNGGTATCTEQAKCEVCDVLYGNLAEHNFATKASGTKDTDATCKAKQTNYVQCDNCDAVSDSKTVEVGELAQHKFGKYNSDKNATCCKDGTKTAKCIWCDKTDTVVDVGSVLLAEHNFATKASGTKDTDATCKAKQTNYVQCDNCDAVSDSKTVEVGELAQHKFGKYNSDKNATCCKDGTKTAKCIWCDKTDTVVDVGSVLGHKDATKIFKDLQKDKWYNDAIDYCYTHGFISGMSKTEFGVNTPVTRGMFITILARIAGVDLSNNNVKTVFTDVESGKYYTMAIKWGYENKVVSGMSATAFEPNSPIQRQQLAVMIVNFAKFMDAEITASEKALKFTDEKTIGNYAKDAVKTAQMADIVNGYEVSGKYEFRPKNTATRAEAAQILYKFHKEFMNK